MDPNKESILKSVQKYHWFAILERDICPLIRSLINGGQITTVFNSALGKEIPAVGDASINGYLFTQKESAKNTGAAIKELWEEKGEDYFKRISGDCVSRARELHDLLRSAISGDLKKDLIQIKEKYCALTPYLLISVFSEKFLEKEIEKLIFDKEGKEDLQLFKSLTYVRKLTKMTEESIAILKITQWIKDNNLSLESVEVSNKIDDHLGRYAWLSTRWYFEEGWTKKEIIPRIEKHLKSDISKEINKISSPREEEERNTQQFIQRHNLNSKEIAIIDFAKEFVYLRTFRTESMARATNLMIPILEKASLELGLPKGDLMYLSMDELISALETGNLDKEAIKERQKKFYYILCDDQFAIFSGEDLAKVEATNVFVFEKIDQENIKGQTAYPGKIQGKVKIVKKKEDVAKLKPGEIMVSVMTTPNFIAAMEKASAFVTDEGGILCHAAIVSREMKKPCVIGTKNATKVLKDGDLIEVDADNGVVKKI